MKRETDRRVSLAALMRPGARAALRRRRRREGKKITIGIPLYNQQHEFWQNIYNTAKSYCAEKGITLIAVDSNYDPAKQVSIMEDMLTKKVDALILGAVDPQGVLPTVDEFVKAKIPVVAVDNPLDRGAVTFVGIDNYSGGEMGGGGPASTSRRSWAARRTSRSSTTPMSRPASTGRRLPGRA